MSRGLVAAAAVVVVVASCRGDKRTEPPPAVAAAPRDATVVLPEEPDPFTAARLEMVEKTIVQRGITDPKVITAMRLTPRHEFVPPDKRHLAYDDGPMPIGFDKTISQAYIVAAMTEAARVKAGDRVLEIGTGSGYQAAVLAVMGAQVYTIEIHEELAARTRDVLKVAGFSQINMKTGDGYFGWPDAAPFDAIIVTCAAPEVPAPLLAQLKVGGRMVIPLEADYDQSLEIITKTDHGMSREIMMDVRFGPMVGEVVRER